jgi:hypothetical protein
LKAKAPDSSGRRSVRHVRLTRAFGDAGKRVTGHRSTTGVGGVAPRRRVGSQPVELALLCLFTRSPAPFSRETERVGGTGRCLPSVDEAVLPLMASRGVVTLLNRAAEPVAAELKLGHPEGVADPPDEFLRVVPLTVFEGAQQKLSLGPSARVRCCDHMVGLS